MLQLQHMKRIVDACYPSWSEEAMASWKKRGKEPSERELKEAWNKEAQELWHDIKAVKFGNSTLWDDSTFLSLATYQIPEDAAYMLILRTECYITTFDPTAVGFAQFAPPPRGTAAWQYTDLSVGSNQYRITPQVPMHILCDTDEMLFAKGDHLLELIISTVSADEATVDRFIRTTVYGYLCGAKIAGRIGSGESTYYGQTDE
jgi:hypothetical protein